MRLIDADALFKDICDSINEMTKIGLCVDGEWLWGKLNDALENAPTIEPIRCGECKYWNEDGTCRILEKYIFNDDYFCVNAERREGDTDG